MIPLIRIDNDGSRYDVAQFGDDEHEQAIFAMDRLANTLAAESTGRVKFGNNINVTGSIRRLQRDIIDDQNRVFVTLYMDLPVR